MFIDEFEDSISSRLIREREVIYRDACNYQAHCWATERVCEFKDAVAAMFVRRGLYLDHPACHELMEELVLRDDIEVYSDMFREIYGVRPRLELDHFRAHNQADRRTIIDELIGIVEGV